MQNGGIVAQFGTVNPCLSTDAAGAAAAALAVVDV